MSIKKITTLALAFAPLVLFAHFALSKPTWNNLREFQLDFDQKTKMIQKKKEFSQRKKIALKIIANIEQDIKKWAQKNSIKPKEIALSEALISVTSVLNSLEINLNTATQKNCHRYIEKMDLFLNQQQKKESSYRLIRALCLN